MSITAMDRRITVNISPNNPMPLKSWLTRDWPAADHTSTFEVQVSLWWVHEASGRPSHECFVTLISSHSHCHITTWERRMLANDRSLNHDSPIMTCTAKVRSVSSESLAYIRLLRWASAQSREPPVSNVMNSPTPMTISCHSPHNFCL